MRENNYFIATGTVVSPGQVTGPVKIVKNSADVKKIGQGDIMVVSQSSPAFAIGVMNASGLICEKGGIMTHICIVAKELGIPCMTQVKDATELLQENSTITLNAAEGIIHGKPK
jgi:phosphohistidine swiveling domain-containing protein